MRAFARALRAMPQGDARLPIDITTERDQDWTDLHEGMLSGRAAG